MRYLSLLEILELHEAIISETGGARGIRDIGALESAVNQPRLKRTWMSRKELSLILQPAS